MPVGQIVRFPEGRGAEDYDATQSNLDIAGNPPEGMIFHAAGEVEGRFQVFNVWESREHADRFEEDRLGPAIKAVVGDEAYAQMPEAERVYTEIHNHVIP